MKPKQKSVTMWAIWEPYTHYISDIALTRYGAWKRFEDRLGYTKVDRKDLLKEGYRAVKGKFVWKEK